MMPLSSILNNETQWILNKAWQVEFSYSLFSLTNKKVKSLNRSQPYEIRLNVTFKNVNGIILHLFYLFQTIAEIFWSLPGPNRGKHFIYTHFLFSV